MKQKKGETYHPTDEHKSFLHKQQTCNNMVFHQHQGPHTPSLKSKAFQVQGCSLMESSGIIIITLLWNFTQECMFFSLVYIFVCFASSFYQQLHAETCCSLSSWKSANMCTSILYVCTIHTLLRIHLHSFTLQQSKYFHNLTSLNAA